MEVPCRFQAWRTVRMIDRGYPSAAKVLARRSGSSAVIRYKFVACYKFRLTAFCYSGEWKLLQNDEKFGPRTVRRLIYMGCARTGTRLEVYACSPENMLESFFV